MIKHIHYSIELEQAILGACLLEQTAMGRTYGLIDRETFYSEDNKIIFSFLKKMYDNNLPIDVITVHLQMQSSAKKIKLHAGQIAWYLTVLTQNVVSTANLEYHCYILKTMWRKRELERLTNSGFDSTGDIKEQIKKLNDDMMNIQANELKKDWQTMDELIYELMLHQDEIRKGKKEFITTGFKAIDNLNGGFSGGQMIVIGARPSVGKSALMGKIAIAQAMKKKSVGIISLEMNNTEIAARLSALETDIEFWRIHRNLFADEQQHQKFYNIISKQLVSLPIYISDKTKVNINDIRSKAAKLKHSHGLDCLMIDYLQLVDVEENKNYNREREVAKMSRGIKLLSMEMNIPVIVLCQLNRQILQRGKHGSSRYPQLSDLRESGAIEQDADVVMMLHRDWLIEGFHEDKDGNSTQFQADLLVQKWRNGAPCHLRLEFEPEKMRFREKDDKLSAFIPVSRNWEKIDEGDLFEQ